MSDSDKKKTFTTAEWAKLDPPKKIGRCGVQKNDYVYSVEDDGTLGACVGKVINPNDGRFVRICFCDLCFALFFCVEVFGVLRFAYKCRIITCVALTFQ